MTRKKKLKPFELKDQEPFNRVELVINPRNTSGNNQKDLTFLPYDENDPYNHNSSSSQTSIDIEIHTCNKPGCKIKNGQIKNGRLIFYCSCPKGFRQYVYKFCLELSDFQGYVYGRVSCSRNGSGTKTTKEYSKDRHFITDTDSLNKLISDTDSLNRLNELDTLVMNAEMYANTEFYATTKDNVSNILECRMVKEPKTDIFIIYSDGGNNELTRENISIFRKMLQGSEKAIDKTKTKKRSFVFVLFNSEQFQDSSTSVHLLHDRDQSFIQYDTRSIKSSIYSDIDAYKYTYHSIEREDEEATGSDKHQTGNRMSHISKFRQCSNPGIRKSKISQGSTISLMLDKKLSSPVMVTSNIEHLRKLLDKSLRNDALQILALGLKFSFLSHGYESFKQGAVIILRPLSEIELNTLDMHNYFNRLATYAQWPIDNPISPLKLAKAGFIYRGNGGTVDCFSCGVSITYLLNDSDPMIMHQMLTPECAFLRSVGVLPLEKNETTINNNASAIDTHLQGITTEIEEDLAVDNITGNLRANLNLKNNENNDENVPNGFEGDNTTQKMEGTLNYSITQESYIDPTRDNDASGNQNVVAQTADATSVHGYELDYTNIATGVNSQLISTVTGNLPEEGNIDDWSIVNDNMLGEAKHPQYISIKSRLESYRSWSYRNIQHPRALVAAGFFHIGYDHIEKHGGCRMRIRKCFQSFIGGKEDIVRCFFCDIGLAEWDTDDDPWVEHARHSPHCLYVRQKRGDEFIENIQAAWRQIYCPKHQQYQDYTIRLQTFRNWPSDLTQRPEQLASAGFFYTGQDDTVRCHYCDGGLRQWEPGDVPWIEHAKWFPFCKFVVKIKGVAFIEEVGRTYDEMYTNQGGIQNGITSNSAGNSQTQTNYQGECQNALTTPAAQSVLEMGFSPNRVKAAINEYIKKTGNREFKADVILGMLFDLDKDLSTTEGITSTSNTLNEAGTVLDDVKNVDVETIGTDRLRLMNEQMKSEIFICTYCKDKDRNMVFIPCGHRIVCESCSKDVKVCLVCSAFVDRCVKTYLS